MKREITNTFRTVINRLNRDALLFKYVLEAIDFIGPTSNKSMIRGVIPKSRYFTNPKINSVIESCIEEGYITKKETIIDSNTKDIFYDLTERGRDYITIAGRTRRDTDIAELQEVMDQVNDQYLLAFQNLQKLKYKVWRMAGALTKELQRRQEEAILNLETPSKEEVIGDISKFLHFYYKKMNQKNKKNFSSVVKMAILEVPLVTRWEVYKYIRKMKGTRMGERKACDIMGISAKELHIILLGLKNYFKSYYYNIWISYEEYKHIKPIVGLKTEDDIAESILFDDTNEKINKIMKKLNKVNIVLPELNTEQYD